MQTISFYSYKGGVGRSLLVANTARFLSLSGLRVVALDLDFEAPGLHYKLRDDEALGAAAAGELKGAVDYLVDALEQDEPPPSLAAYAITIRTPPDLPGSIRLIPAGAAPHPHYWSLLARLGEVRREHEAEGSLAMALLDLAARIEEELRADYLLIDARTGVTELGGLATTALADRVVCLSLPTDECMDGTSTVVEALALSKRPLGQPKAVVEVLLSRAGKERGTSLKEIERAAGAAKASHVLHHDDSSVEAEQHLGSDHVAQRRSGLLAETLDWLERTFPNVGKGSVSAARRMRAVDSVVEVLTHRKPTPTPSHEGGSRWSVAQIRNGVTFTSGNTKRFADLALYVDAKAPADPKPDMVVEYVGNAAPKPIASWWIGRAAARAVCLIIDADEHRDFSLELFTDRCRDGVTIYRNTLPSSEDFSALDDVADQSPEARLAAVGKGHRGYTYQLVRDWALSTEATVHGGMPWRPDRARAIEDAFVAGGGHLFVLGGAWLCDEHMGVGSSGRALADRVSRDLLAPVWWRTDLDAAHDFDRERRHHDGQHLAVHAFVATRLMGLRYDPDDQLRQDAGALFQAGKNGERGRYLDHEHFKGLEMSYDLKASVPAADAREVALRLGLSDSSKKDAPLPEPDSLIRAVRARSLLATVGVLGTYDPETSTLRFYRPHIAAAADILGIPVAPLERVVHMHLAVLAYAHLGRDADGRMWETFALPQRIGVAVQPGTDLTTIVQYFVFRLIERLADARLRDAFERLSDVQPLPYRQWRALAHVPIEDVRAWLMTMRRGTGADGAARLAMLLSSRSGRE